MKQEKRVSLLRYVRTNKGWTRRRVPEPASTKRGWEKRVDTEMAAYGPDVIDMGEYQIRWYESRRGESVARFESGGTTYIGAMAIQQERIDRLSFEQSAKKLGYTPPPEPNERKPLPDGIEVFLNQRAAKKKITSEHTREVYRLALTGFFEITKVRYIEQVNAEILVAYLNELQRRKLSDQTQMNYFMLVGAYLCEADKNLRPLIREYTPKISKKKKKPVSYTEEELNKFLGWLRGHREGHKYRLLALVAETYYKTGLREHELTHLAWDNVDLKAGLIWIRDGQNFHLKVRGKQKDVLFRTKTRRDRDVPIPIAAGLLGRLREWREKNPHDRFLFPTRKGNPDHNYLFKIRTAICHAGMNCGVCENCVQPCGYCQHCRCRKCKGCRHQPLRKCIHPTNHGDHPCGRIQCLKWKLHRLRHTFATNAVRSGTDLGMVQHWLGHEDLGTTQIYIDAAQEAEAKAAINRAFGD